MYKSRLRAPLILPAIGLLLLLTTLVWPGTSGATAQEPELTPRVYLPLVMGHQLSTLDGCEPNGMPALACPIEPGTHQAHISSLYDQDWYTYDLGNDSQVTLRLRVPEDDNYDLYLYGDPPGRPISYSVTAGNAEEGITATLPPGSYYILVFPAVQASEFAYELALEVS